MRNQEVKRLLAVALTIILGLSLIGCGSTSKQESNVQKENDENNNDENKDEFEDESEPVADDTEEDTQVSTEPEGDASDTADSYIVYDYTGLQAFFIGKIEISQVKATDKEVVAINDVTVMRGNDSSYPVGYIPKGTVFHLSGYRINPITHKPDSLQISNPLSGTEDEYLYILPEDVETVDGSLIEE